MNIVFNFWKNPWRYKPHGKGKYQSMDNTKMGVKVDSSYKKKRFVDIWQEYIVFETYQHSQKFLSVRREWIFANTVKMMPCDWASCYAIYECQNISITMSFVYVCQKYVNKKERERHLPGYFYLATESSQVCVALFPSC